MEPRHRAIAEIALAAAGAHGIALAGGYAVREHGIGHRPSGDIDLFTDWHRRTDFPAVVEKVIAALEQHGYKIRSLPRAKPLPVLLGIGPVLHPDDAVTNKVCALYGRALARDFSTLTPSSSLAATHGNSCCGSPKLLTQDSTGPCFPRPLVRSRRSPTRPLRTTARGPTRSPPCVGDSASGATS